VGKVQFSAGTLKLQNLVISHIHEKHDEARILWQMRNGAYIDASQNKGEEFCHE